MNSGKRCFRSFRKREIDYQTFVAVSILVISVRRIGKRSGSWNESRKPRSRPITISGDKMRFMVMVKATEDSEAGLMPTEQDFAAMGAYNEELVKAGVMLAGEGLHPSSKGARVLFSGDKRTVTDGPFAETKELVAGFWLWQVKSKEEAIEWLKRAPFDGGTEIELRQIFETEDFGAEMTPELRQQEDRLRAQAEKNARR
jgi:hypothetical protein